MNHVDELIRGELAAVRGLDSLMAKVHDVNERNHLNSFRQDHLNALEVLKRFANSDIEDDLSTSGPWDEVTDSFSGNAGLFKDKSAVASLKTGEEHSIQEYKSALEDDSINMELREAIRSDIIPWQQRHLEAIERFSN